MKTIGYIDLTDKNYIYLFNPKEDQVKENWYKLTRMERLIRALNELRHVGNIAIYYIRGNKRRLIAIR